MLNRKMEIVMKKFVLTSILAMFVTTQYSAEAGLFGIGTNKAVADYLKTNPQKKLAFDEIYNSMRSDQKAILKLLDATNRIIDEIGESYIYGNTPKLNNFEQNSKLIYTAMSAFFKQDNKQPLFKESKIDVEVNSVINFLNTTINNFTNKFNLNLINNKNIKKLIQNKLELEKKLQERNREYEQLSQYNNNIKKQNSSAVELAKLKTELKQIEEVLDDVQLQHANYLQNKLLESVRMYDQIIELCNNFDKHINELNTLSENADSEKFKNFIIEFIEGNGNSIKNTYNNLSSGLTQINTSIEKNINSIESAKPQMEAVALSNKLDREIVNLDTLANTICGLLDKYEPTTKQTKKIKKLVNNIIEKSHSDMSNQLDARSPQ